MNQFSIRTATPGDEPLMNNLLQAEFEISGGMKGEFKRKLPAAGEYRSRGGEIWVIVSKRAVFGCFGLLPDQKGGAEVIPFILAPGWRGLGLGRLIFDTGKAFGQEKSFSSLWITVPLCFSSSIGPLESCGFRKAEVPSHIVLPESTTYLEWR